MENFQVLMNMHLVIYILILLFPELICAQSNRILSLLQEGNFRELSGLRAEAVGAEKAFLEAVFETDGFRAILRYKDIIDDYPQTPFYYEAVQRLKEYRALKGDAPMTFYWIQAGAFAEYKNAEKLKMELTKIGFKVKVVQKAGDTTLYLVRVGAFASESEAKDASRRIENKLSVKAHLVTEGG
jgi:hypothetical protein